MATVPSQSAASASAAQDLVVIAGEYEVFLSFRGADTRYGFTDYLYNDLIGAGVRTFRDDNELRVGEEIGPELLRAIKDSKISIPIFSKNYASSKWCLRELAQMVDCKANGGQMIYPIFYDVEPSEVQHQSGNYKEAFHQYEKSESLDEKIVKQWKAALEIVGDLKGLELKKKTNCLEANLDRVLELQPQHDLLSSFGRARKRKNPSDINFAETKGSTKQTCLLSGTPLNARLRLDREVLAEKINKDASRATTGEDGGGSMLENQFSPLNRNVIIQNQEIEGMKAWAEVVAPNRDRLSGIELHYVDPIVPNDENLICFKAEDVETEILRWRKALIVYVLGIWGMKVYLLKSGVYIIEFKDVKTRIEILEAGPWSFDNRPLIVKLWSPQVNLEKEDIAAVPVWVRLPNLKLHLWSTAALSKMASRIGKPLFTDRMTAERERLAYPWVCVEVKVGTTLPEVLDLQDVDGMRFIQKKGEQVANVKVVVNEKGTDVAVIKHVNLVNMHGEGCSTSFNGRTDNDHTVSEEIINNGHYVEVVEPSSLQQKGKEQIVQANQFEVLTMDDGEDVIEAWRPEKGRRKKKVSPNVGGGCVHNATDMSVGKVWIAWNPLTVDVQALRFNDQSIDCKIVWMTNRKELFLTGVYGRNTREERHVLWRDLRSFHGVVYNMPWIILGDFNAVRNIDDRQGAHLLRGLK
ncbi:hypothetical protein LguiA_018439 [Lonicera macranthoides]